MVDFMGYFYYTIQRTPYINHSRLPYICIKSSWNRPKIGLNSPDLKNHPTQQKQISKLASNTHLWRTQWYRGVLYEYLSWKIQVPQVAFWIFRVSTSLHSKWPVFTIDFLLSQFVQITISKLCQKANTWKRGVGMTETKIFRKKPKEKKVGNKV